MFPMFGDMDEQHTPPEWDTRVMLSQGGWSGKKWMTAKELNAALDRWASRSYATGVPDEKYPGWLPFQCGGCRFFGAFDGDYGLCCNPVSGNDGRVVFEHGGCPQHSEIPAQEAS